MQRRQLGRSGLWIAPMVLGGNVFGWTADVARSLARLDAFVHAGFDTTALDAVAFQVGATPAQATLAWLLAQPGVTAPIVGVDTRAHLREALGGARLALDGQQLGALTAASAS